MNRLKATVIFVQTMERESLRIMNPEEQDCGFATDAQKELSLADRGF